MFISAIIAVAMHKFIEIVIYFRYIFYLIYINSIKARISVKRPHGVNVCQSFVEQLWSQLPKN